MFNCPFSITVKSYFFRLDSLTKEVLVMNRILANLKASLYTGIC